METLAMITIVLGVTALAGVLIAGLAYLFKGSPFLGWLFFWTMFLGE